MKLDKHSAGRHFLQIPGPSPVPDRILRAISLPTIDHRGPEFGALGLQLLDALQRVFRTRNPVVIYPASGTGAWEAALANTMSSGDALLMYETGHFASLWHKMAQRLGLQPEFIGDAGVDSSGLPSSWRRGVQADLIEQRLRADTAHRIKAVCVVHNETSTGVTSNIPAVRRAIDAAKHPALSPKAIEAAKHAKLPKAFWAWDDIVEMNRSGYWPYTPSTNLLYGLHEALAMLHEEGLPNVFARHARWGEGVRCAVRAWGLEIQCTDPAVYSPVLTGVVMPKGIDADLVRKTIHDRFDMSLGTGLGKVKGRMFRIGHLGDCNDLTLMAALSGCEMGLKLCGVPLAASGVQAAMDFFASHPQQSALAAAA